MQFCCLFNELATLLTCKIIWQCKLSNILHFISQLPVKKIRANAIVEKLLFKDNRVGRKLHTTNKSAILCNYVLTGRVLYYLTL